MKALEYPSNLGALHSGIGHKATLVLFAVVNCKIQYDLLSHLRDRMPMFIMVSLQPPSPPLQTKGLQFTS